MNVKKKFLNIIRRNEEKECSVNKKQLKAKKKRIRKAKKKLEEIRNEQKANHVKESPLFYSTLKEEKEREYLHEFEINIFRKDLKILEEANNKKTKENKSLKMYMRSLLDFVKTLVSENETLKLKVSKFVLGQSKASTDNVCLTEKKKIKQLSNELRQKRAKIRSLSSELTLFKKKKDVSINEPLQFSACEVNPQVSLTIQKSIDQSKNKKERILNRLGKVSKIKKKKSMEFSILFLPPPPGGVKYGIYL